MRPRGGDHNVCCIYYLHRQPLCEMLRIVSCWLFSVLRRVTPFVPHAPLDLSVRVYDKLRPEKDTEYKARAFPYIVAHRSCRTPPSPYRFPPVLLLMASQLSILTCSSSLLALSALIAEVDAQSAGPGTGTGYASRAPWATTGRYTNTSTVIDSTESSHAYLPTLSAGVSNSASTCSFTAPILTETAPPMTSIQTVPSGPTATIPAIWMTESSTYVPLPAVLTIAPTGTQASSSASVLSGELNTLLPTLKAWTKSDDDPDEIIQQVKHTQVFAEHLLGGISHGGDSGSPKKKKGCTASLFSLVSCIVGDVSKVVTNVENTAKNLVDDVLPELEDYMKHLLDNFGKNNDDVNKKTKSHESKTHSSGTSSISTYTASSSTCTKASTVYDVYTSCSPTLLSSSVTNTCTTKTSTVTGCDITASSSATTASSSSSSSSVQPIYQTFFIDPAPPDIPQKSLDAVSSELMRQFAQYGLLPALTGAVGGTGTGSFTTRTSTSIQSASITSTANPAGVIASILGNTALAASASALSPKRHLAHPLPQQRTRQQPRKAR